MSVLLDSSELLFDPESRDVRETTILQYLLYSSLEKSPELPATNVQMYTFITNGIEK